MKILTTIIITFLSLTCLGQQFMIENGDTVQYEIRMEVNGEDTVYLGSCNTFDKKENEVINLTVNCLPKGYWEIEKEDGAISKGNYTSSGKLTGIWKTYDRKGGLVKEKEYTSSGSDTYVLREIQYKDGEAIIISEKTWFARLYHKNVFLIGLTLGFMFLSRIFINSPIYNRQNGTHYSPIYFFIGPHFSNNYEHSIRCTFTFWWSIKKLKEENIFLARMSNFLSIVAVGMFFAIIIGLATSGEIK